MSISLLQFSSFSLKQRAQRPIHRLKSPIVYFRSLFAKSEPFCRNFVIEDKEVKLALLRPGSGFWSLVFLYGAGLGHGLLGRTPYHRRGREFAELLVNRHPIVIKSGRLQNNARSAYQNRQREDPKKQTVQHHRYVLPVLLYLRRRTI